MLTSPQMPERTLSKRAENLQVEQSAFDEALRKLLNTPASAKDDIKPSPKTRAQSSRSTQRTESR